MNRLRAYRRIEGLNQEELGRRLGVSASMISGIEAGRRTMSCDLSVLGYAQERLELPEMTTPLHRHKASTTVAAKNRAQELLRLAGELFMELRGRTERAPQTTLERIPPMATTHEDIEELAREVRYLLRQEEHGPIRNLTTAVEKAGVCLIPMAALPGVDGLSSWVNDVPVIGIAPQIPGDRFRFTLAHELMHLVAHIRRTDNTEPEANHFAGALLIPHSELELAMPSYPHLRDFIALKSSWGISVAAMVYRAHQLDFIDDRRYRALQIQMAKWRKSEPGNFSPMHGQLLPRLVDMNGGVETVASELGLNSRHVADLTNWNHLRVA